MTSFLRYCRYIIALGVLTLSALAFLNAFYPIPVFDVQVSALLQRVLLHPSWVAAILLVGVLALTLLFGRIYCSTLCPLGIYQELLTLLFRRKFRPVPNSPYKYILATVLFALMACGTVWLLRYIDPYSLFGAAMSGVYWAIAVLVLLAMLVWFKGRFFCTHICPAGTLLGLVSRISLFKIYLEEPLCVSCGMCARQCPTGSIDFKNKRVNNETCVKCFRCMTGCKRSGVHYGIAKNYAESAPSASQRNTASPHTVASKWSRRRFIFTGSLTLLFIATYKTGKEICRSLAERIHKVLVPAGGGGPQQFANRCLNCNLCVQYCPNKILKPANEQFQAVHVDYGETGICKLDCNMCSQVCPSGAIKRMSLQEKQHTQMALAHIDADTCVKCGICVTECPKHAITKEGPQTPVVHNDICIGCGLCRTVCPVRAITVQAVQEQRTLPGMS